MLYGWSVSNALGWDWGRSVTYAGDVGRKVEEGGIKERDVLLEEVPSCGKVLRVCEKSNMP